MNWKQLHALANHQERLEAILHMLRALEARQRRRVLVRGRFILGRRRAQAAHWLNDRRGRYAMLRIIIPLTFILTLLTVSVATWLFVVHAPIQLATIALIFHLTALWVVIAFKPYHFRSALGL